MSADRFEYALRLGDNALILSHRLSQWCGHGPALEEDIALTNVALDLIGQAQFWLGLAGELEGAGRSADDLAYKRDAGEFRNVLLVERPNGDYGHTLMRQYLFDAWHAEALRGAGGSTRRRASPRSPPRRRKRSPITSSAPANWSSRSATERAKAARGCRRRWTRCGPMPASCLSATPSTRGWREAGVAPAAESLRPAWTRAIGGRVRARRR